MVTNCINCNAPIDNSYDKCPFCNTPYDISGFNASFEAVGGIGALKIAGREYNVYLGKCEHHLLDSGCYRDSQGVLCRGDVSVKRKFTLIEI